MKRAYNGLKTSVSGVQIYLCPPVIPRVCRLLDFQNCFKEWICLMKK